MSAQNLVQGYRAIERHITSNAAFNNIQKDASIEKLLEKLGMSWNEEVDLLRSWNLTHEKFLIEWVLL
jgi:hypothetical protein